MTLTRLWTDDDGQGLVEYGLIIALVAVMAIGALVLLSDWISGIFGRIQEDADAAMEGTG